MSAALDLPYPMSLTEFLAWDAPDGGPWQLVDGQPTAMAPASPVHAVIQNELGRLIGNHLRASGGQCVAAGTPGILLGRKEDRNFRIPDLGVTCSPLVPGEPALPNPILLIEILSPSNPAETWINVWAYTTIPSVREILVIRTDAAGAQLLRRQPDGGWPTTPAAIENGEVVLESIEFRLALEAVYAGTWLAVGLAAG
jgi:Uma2 family endonuclease